MTPHAQPDEIGLDPRWLGTAFDLLERWTIGPGAPIPGAALVVGRHDRILKPRFFGHRGPDPDAGPLGPDAVFLLASIAKPVIAIGVMILVERGVLDLAAPVADYISEFTGGGKSEVCVHHLLTHTSGLPDRLANEFDLRRRHAPRQEYLDAAVRDTNLLFAPGTQLRYQSTGFAVTAEIILRLTGLPVDAFLAREVFDPLGMTSTALGGSGIDLRRLVHVRPPVRALDRTSDWNSEYWRALGVPWGGLLGTPHDLAVLCQLMLGDGIVGGVRVLGPSSVRHMTANRLDDYPAIPEEVRRGQPWGLGWRRNHSGGPATWGDLLGEHTFGHTGATGSGLWVDPDTGGFCVLCTNAGFVHVSERWAQLSNVIARAFL